MDIALPYGSSLLVVARYLFQQRTVTAEAAGSSPVVPAIHSKRVVPVSLKPSRTQKGTFSCSFLCPFWPSFSSHRGFLHAAASAEDADCEVPVASVGNTNDQTAACAACFAGVIACV